MSKTYCPLPWVHSSWQNGNTILPCCGFMDGGRFNKTSVFEKLYFDNEMDQLRADMLAGKTIKGCEQCYDQENNNLDSMRTRALDKYGIVTTIDLQDLHIMFDNLCNLKCRMCASSNSHLWHVEEKELYGEAFSSSKYFQNTFYKEVNLKNIKEINLTGGEPLYSPHFIPFLKKLKEEADTSQIYIDFFTNGTIQPTKISVNVLTTVGIYNAIYVEDIKNYFSLNYPKFNWGYDVIQYPEYLSIRHMPTNLKDIYKEYIKEEPLISYMYDSGKDLFKHFLYSHYKLNKIRNEDFTENNILLNYIKNNNTDIYEEETKKYYKNMINEIRGSRD